MKNILQNLFISICQFLGLVCFIVSMLLDIDKYNNLILLLLLSMPAFFLLSTLLYFMLPKIKIKPQPSHRLCIM